MPERDDLTRLLEESAAGDETAAARLFPIVYDELRRLAGAALRRERPSHTLQPTALVHEAFLRLVDVKSSRLQDRGHFIAIAARAMRRVLVDHARSRGAVKRGKAEARLSIDDVDVAAADASDMDLVALDQALERLAAIDERQARIVELRFFGGLTVEETAVVIGASDRTVKRDWQMARAWLRRELARDSDSA
jgi:RNA polymerase sigma-70 factor (ECF subfamily)